MRTERFAGADRDVVDYWVDRLVIALIAGTSVIGSAVVLLAAAMTGSDDIRTALWILGFAGLTFSTTLAMRGAARALRRHLERADEHESHGRVIGREVTMLVGTLPFLIGAVSLLLEAGGGLYWVAAGFVTAIAGGVTNAWVLLVGDPALMDDVVSLHDFEPLARAAIEPGAFGYVAGGAWDELTLAENLAAWRRRTLRPRVLIDVSGVTAATTLLGAAASMPVAIAPVAAHGLMHPDGELATARAAAAAGVPFILSTFASRSIEAVAEAAPDATRWFQLYVQTDARTDARPRRARGRGGLRRARAHRRHARARVPRARPPQPLRHDGPAAPARPAAAPSSGASRRRP